MIWLWFLIPLAVLIGIAVYVEKRGQRMIDDANLTHQDKRLVEDKYLEHGAQHEAQHPKNL
ncbi:hypothetical protein [Thalassobacillus hwangdonensis]|uniref:SigE-dependent sporulation protein n=1 Tax=Thalassobacillus hwangdonensis TaxID=546108 RepID=A0ABW3L026_9BACI